MAEPSYKTICILGRQPQLGAAELESLYGPRQVKNLGLAAALSLEAEKIAFNRLGGTLKTARILNNLETTSWPDLADYLLANIPKHLEYVPPGKFTFGLSLYGFKLPLKKLQKDLLRIKSVIKKSGRPVRLVPNKNLALNSAQVLHNKLTSRGAWELLFIRDGSKTILAQTLFVQDIEAYGARDQARPKRDARVGMLPPKLAQIMVNLTNPQASDLVLDPFCGTGVILQEALLMDYKVLGTDIDPRMTEYSKTNLAWLSQKYPTKKFTYHVEAADATVHQWTKTIRAVASEVYLGRPLTSLPALEKLKPIIYDVNTIVKKFLINLLPQLDRRAKVCLAVPAWRGPEGGLIRLPVVDELSVIGYNQVDFRHVGSSSLIYFRGDQTVARQLLVLSKR